MPRRQEEASTRQEDGMDIVESNHLTAIPYARTWKLFLNELVQHYLNLQAIQLRNYKLGY